MTCKARKINKLFGYEYDPETLKKINGIGWDMIHRVTCSADSISRLTNPQIRYIIDYVTSKIVNIVNNQILICQLKIMSPLVFIQAIILLRSMRLCSADEKKDHLTCRQKYECTSNIDLISCS